MGTPLETPVFWKRCLAVAVHCALHCMHACMMESCVKTVKALGCCFVLAGCCFVWREGGVRAASGLGQGARDRCALVGDCAWLFGIVYSTPLSFFSKPGVCLAFLLLLYSMRVGWAGEAAWRIRPVSWAPDWTVLIESLLEL